MRQKPLFVLSFILVLGLPQIAGLTKQFQLGFRPFAENPIRVPFSWDMFATRVDRCTVTWDAPLTLGPRKVQTLREIELPLEWDIVFDQVAGYQAAARALCRYSTAKPNTAQLDCFTADGLERHDEVSCD